ncbi:hypothetical protein [Bradyrhizobium sp. SZCCHNPS1003]|nr:hypothetical protein [Bradyrhizobium sp. SZCCHNPS1003]
MFNRGEWFEGSAFDDFDVAVARIKVACGLTDSQCTGKPVAIDRAYP